MVDPLHPLSVLFLGTSSCTPEKGGNTASMLVDRRVVIDAGWYLTDRILAADVDPLAFEAVLFTHCHHDHILGLPQLLFYYGISRKRRPERPLHVYGPAGEIGRVVADGQRYLQLDRYPELDFDLEVHDVAPGDAFAAGDLRVTTCASRHNVPGLCYRIANAHGATAAFSGDTRFNPDLAELARGAGLLVHEASRGGSSSRGNDAAAHSGAPDAAEIARQAGVRRLALVHCGPAAREQALAAAKVVFANSFFPREGEEVLVEA